MGNENKDLTATEIEQSADVEESVEEEVKLSQEEVNRLIAQAKSKAKDEAKKELESETAKKAEELANQKLADEKAKQELNSEQLEEYYKSQLEQKENEFNQRLAAYEAKETKRELTDLSIRVLGEKSLPVNDKVLGFVVKDNEANTRQAIDDLAKIISEEKNILATSTEPNVGGGISRQDNRTLFDIFDQKTK